MMEAGKGLWSLIQDQILGMKWLKDAVGAGLTAMGTDISSRLGGSVHFFIYDIIKITILLCTLIFVISYIQSYFPPERSKRILGRFHGLGARIAAALLGTVTPFCSCSSIRSCKTRMRSAGGVLVGEEGRANPKVRRASSST